MEEIGPGEIAELLYWGKVQVGLLEMYLPSLRAIGYLDMMSYC